MTRNSLTCDSNHITDIGSTHRTTHGGGLGNDSSAEGSETKPDLNASRNAHLMNQSTIEAKDWLAAQVVSK